LIQIYFAFLMRGHWCRPQPARGNVHVQQEACQQTEVRLSRHGAANRRRDAVPRRRRSRGAADAGAAQLRAADRAAMCRMPQRLPGTLDVPPLAMMLIPTFTHTGASQSGGAAPRFGPNDNFARRRRTLEPRRSKGRASGHRRGPARPPRRRPEATGRRSTIRPVLEPEEVELTLSRATRSAWRMVEPLGLDSFEATARSVAGGMPGSIHLGRSSVSRRRSTSAAELRPKRSS
jgi:hypothetical protein